MLIDCATCPAAGRRCTACVVPAITGISPVLPLDRQEAAAVGMLAGLGLISAAEAAQAHAIREPVRTPGRPAAAFRQVS